VSLHRFNGYGLIFSKLIDIIRKIRTTTIPFRTHHPTQNINRAHEKAVKEWVDLLRLRAVGHLRCGDFGCRNIRWWEVQARKGTSHKLMDNVRITKVMPTRTTCQWRTRTRRQRQASVSDERIMFQKGETNVPMLLTAVPLSSCSRTHSTIAPIHILICQ
jgi:hypothetical protein